MYEATRMARYRVDGLGVVDLYDIAGEVCLLEGDLAVLIGYKSSGSVRQIIETHADLWDHLLHAKIPQVNKVRRAFVTARGAVKVCEYARRERSRPFGVWLQDFLGNRGAGVVIPQSDVSNRIHRLEKRIGELEERLEEAKGKEERVSIWTRFTNAFRSNGVDRLPEVQA